MNKYLLFLSFFGSIAFADTLPMNHHEVPEQYKIKPKQINNEEIIQISLTDSEFHFMLDALNLAAESIQKKDPYYANKLRGLRYELLPDFKE